MNCKYIIPFLFLVFSSAYSQEWDSRFSIGVKSGAGSEFKNRNYSFTNSYYKLEFDYELIKREKMSYSIVIQPEINFGTHQLLNLYFVKPEEENAAAKREQFTQLKDINQYVLNIGFLARKKLYKQLSGFVLISVGPMISDTVTERLSKGFAFSDVLAVGLSYNLRKIRFDITPSVRHVSNAGLQSSNAGFNTKNIDFGLVYNLQ